MADPWCKSTFYRNDQDQKLFLINHCLFSTIHDNKICPVTINQFLYREKKSISTAGVHQMRPFCRHPLIIIIIIVVVLGHLKSFHPQKQRFSSFENNTGQTDGPTDRRTDRRTDGRTDALWVKTR